MLQFRCPLLIFITSLRWPRDTVEMQGIELVAIFSLLSSLFSLFSAPSSLLSSALDSRNRIPAFLQGIMPPPGLLPCKNARILAVARDPVNFQGIWPAALDWALSGHLRMTSMPQNTFSKKPFNLEPFFWLRFGSHRGGHGTP